MNAGDRVQIRTEYHWAQGATGTIVDHLEPRIVESLRGPLLCYWVEFDEPQHDADGDGPYVEAEIEANALSLLP